MKKNQFIFIILYLLIYTGCSPQYYLKKNIDTFADKNILMIEPLFLSDIYGVEKDEDKFNRNLFVGAISFDGGIITNEKMGMIRQSERRTFEKQEDFRAVAKKMYLATLKEIVQEKKLQVQFVENPAQSGIEIKNIIDIASVNDRRRYEEDGQDNINIPRGIFSIDSLSTSFLEWVKKSTQAGTVVIPVIEYYYGHTGGWFNDQEWGCASGGRMSFHLYAFDVKTGKVIFSFRNTEKNIIKFHYHMSHHDMSRVLYSLEMEMSKKIKSVFP